MKLFCLLAGLAVASAHSFKIGATEDEWAMFKKENNKKYETDTEHDYRASVFAANMEWARDYNSKHSSHWVGATPLADLTHDEYKNLYLSSMADKKSNTEYGAWEYNNVEADDSVDWRTKGAVTPVKDQGQCGSCWAFSTTGSSEGANFLANGKLVSLSEQELVDCAGSTGNMGCNGGLMDNAFKWIVQNGGITTESNYPYTAQDGQCNKNKESDHAVVLSGFTDVPANNEGALKQAVASQPVSIAIEADQQVFQLYKGGILDDASCGTQLDHGVLVVGYCQGQNCPDVSSLSDGNGFWIVKNSWSATWGEQGYIRLAMNTKAPQGMCGIAMAASYPKAGGAGPSPSGGPSPAPSPSGGPSPSGSPMPSPSGSPMPSPSGSPMPSPSGSPMPSPSDSPSPAPSGGGCPSGTCPAGTTCCPMNAAHSTWGCCPMASAVCCSDFQHCCPNGTTCDVSDNTCNRGGNVVGFAGSNSLYAALGL